MDGRKLKLILDGADVGALTTQLHKTGCYVKVAYAVFLAKKGLHVANSTLFQKAIKLALSRRIIGSNFYVNSIFDLMKCYAEVHGVSYVPRYHVVLDEQISVTDALKDPKIHQDLLTADVIKLGKGAITHFLSIKHGFDSNSNVEYNTWKILRIFTL